MVTPTPGTPAWYSTQIGPDGQGHLRCGAACIASAILEDGHDGDAYQLMLEVTQAGNFSDGATSAEMLAVADQYGYDGRIWHAWQDALNHVTPEPTPAAHVMVLCNNWDLRPRAYPPGGNWNALHWIKLRAVIDRGVMAYVYDPLTYMPQSYPEVYQGPTIYTVESVRAAIRNAPTDEAGVLIWKR